MTRSESIAELAKALCKAQGAMLFAKKDSANPFFKSKYADLASVVEAAKKPLAENGLSYIQMPRADAAGVTVETLLMHVSGEWIASDLFMVPTKGGPARRRLNYHIHSSLCAAGDVGDSCRKMTTAMPPAAT